MALAATAAFLAGASSAAFAQNAQEEVNKQIAKLIGDAISNRVSAKALDAAIIAVPCIAKSFRCPACREAKNKSV